MKIQDLDSMKLKFLLINILKNKQTKKLLMNQWIINVKIKINNFKYIRIKHKWIKIENLFYFTGL
jgi:hypothetical protein